MMMLDYKGGGGVKKSGKSNYVICKCFRRQNMQNQTIFESYTDDNKAKYSSNPKDIFKSAKKIMKHSTPNRSSHMRCSIKKVFL